MNNIKELKEKAHYPKDIFVPISKKRLREINGFLKTNFGFPLDRLSAHICREIEQTIREETLIAVGKEIDELLKWDVHNVLNGKLPKQRLEDFREGFDEAYSIWKDRMKELKSKLEIPTEEKK